MSYTPLNVRTTLVPATDTQPQKVRARARFGGVDGDLRSYVAVWNYSEGGVYENHLWAAKKLLAEQGITGVHLRMEREGATGYAFQVVS
jgi:hypothetical protein